MKSVYSASVSAIALTMALAAPAVGAEQPQTQSSPTPAPSATEQPGVISSTPSPGEPGWTTNKRADDLDDRDVVNAAGEEIGEVEGIVRNKETNDVYAVVSVGGFLGIGDRDVLLSLRDLQLRGDKLEARFATKEELESRPEYEEDRYEEVDSDLMVSVGGGEAGGAAAQDAGLAIAAPGGQTPSFSEIDADNDGYLTKSEVEDREQVASQWDQLDQNNDDKLDQSEFAAFEPSSTSSGVKPMEGGDGQN